MNDHGKSDGSVVPKKSSNKAPERAAETAEGRGPAGGKTLGCNTPRTQSREGVPSALERIREAARRDGKQRFTALFHHVYDVGRLKMAYATLRRDASPGVDGETWRHYGENLEGNLQDLSARLKRGAYRAKPARRTFIPKADGRLRPIGVPALEDKIVQRAAVEVLNAIYEVDFAQFSYGFRPGRNANQAVDALALGIETRKVNWILDADIRSFFDTLRHDCLVKFVEERVGDRRLVRLIQKWLSAGVLEDGTRTVGEVGTVQGGSISPLLANLYLHHVFDLWAHRWRRTRANGDVVIVRYADDFVVGFQDRSDAEKFQSELRERMAEHGLELHPEKTRLLEFGRFAATNRAKRGAKKPETFEFLGFTHCCGKTKSGAFTVLRKTSAKRLRAKLAEVKEKLRQRRHTPVPDQGSYLRSVVRGHVNYYGVPRNAKAIRSFRYRVEMLWWKSLSKRSQRGYVPQARMSKLLHRWIPPARVCHPWPDARFRVTTRCKSRMR